LLNEAVIVVFCKISKILPDLLPVIYFGE